MSLNKIINTLKTPKEEMSAISFNIPLKLKKQLTKIAKKNGFTVNAFLVAMIDDVLNGELKEKKNLEIVEKLSELINRRNELLSGADGEKVGEQTFDGFTNMNEEIDNIDFMIELLKEIKWGQQLKM